MSDFQTKQIPFIIYFLTKSVVPSVSGKNMCFPAIIHCGSSDKLMFSLGSCSTWVCFVLRSSEDQSSVGPEHRQHVRSCTRRLQRRAAHYDGRQVGWLSVFSVQRCRSAGYQSCVWSDQVPGLRGCAGGVWRGDSGSGCGGSVHVHPSEPGFGRSAAAGDHAVCGQVQLCSTQHRTLFTTAFFHLHAFILQVGL